MQGHHAIWNEAWQRLQAFGDVPFPRWIPVRQKYAMPSLSNLSESIHAQLSQPEIRRRIAPGAKVALAVGSRGVANIGTIVAEVAKTLRDWGAEPFIVPAMGSHGASTAAGQAEYLVGLGVSEATTGAPIRATMDVVQLGTTNDGINVYFDAYASEADAVIPICRVKPHTSFRGPIESGPTKMLAIGMGKQKGAESLHAKGFSGFAQRLMDAAELVCATYNVPFAVCSVENARDETAHLEVVPGDQLFDREPRLLKQAWELMGRIMLDSLDVLVVGGIGKNVSGMGMDPNVIGRYSVPDLTGHMKVSKLAVLDVTDESHGNSLGIGLADLITERVLQKTDLGALYVNVVTSTVFTGAKIPVCAKTDRDAIGVALRTCNRQPTTSARLAFIESTKELEHIYISEALWQHERDSGSFEALGPLEEIPFDESGRLIQDRHKKC